MPLYLSPDSPSSSIIISPLTPKSINPVSVVPVMTPPIFTPIDYKQIDTGLNDSWLAQKQMTKHVHYKILDYWLYKSEMKSLLKFMKVNNGVVNVVKSESEYENNDISNDSQDDLEKKADYIEEHYLSLEKMRKILQKIINELGYRWKNFARRNRVTNEEKVVVKITKKYLKKEFKKNFN